MNIIRKHPVSDIGYHFIEKKYLPAGKDEYYLRHKQANPKAKYQALSKSQIEVLMANRNSSDNWDNVRVAAGFNPALVKNCKFFGLVRIGKLESLYHEFHNLRMPVGIYNSTIISCDLGDNVCIDNVNYMSHYIIAEDVMLANINELATTDKAKFGNGILKEGETDEKQRMRIEVCNENGGRSIIPYNGMLAGDAYLWSKYRDDTELLERLTDLTEKKFDKQRGYYGKIQARTVIKNCRIIKDTWIGSDAYIKGANKLKNLTINSDADRNSQIGEGCELVNGIIGYGCRIFYGVKAVRFITASHSQLKYGARLIHSYLGNNSTISCCEVLNSMIFPGHEQHHNNSFLCASLVMGQSNIAAGVTIGSNHNSRGADGEIIAGRGFWPGLCVSLKHNSKFASFTILAKADYPAELNIPVPFSLVSNDVAANRLVVMPAYWFMYNMYALVRNAWKYKDRDKRIQRTQLIEYDYLAPDTINEIMQSIQLLKNLPLNSKGDAEVKGWENSSRPALITKVAPAIKAYQEMVALYACQHLMAHINENKYTDFSSFKQSLRASIGKSQWQNVGGQLMREEAVGQLKANIKSGKLKSWEAVHAFYQTQGNNYSVDVMQHAYNSLLDLDQISSRQFTDVYFLNLLNNAITTRQWIAKGILQSREKDYNSPFRQMVYENRKEMDQVLGKLEDNSFIQTQFKELDLFVKQVNKIKKAWKLK